jgi:hypothetical protein
MTRVWVCVVGLLLMSCGGAANGPPATTSASKGSEGGDLAARLMARIRYLKPDVQIERRGPLHLRLTKPDSDLFLDNLNNACQNDPPRCDGRIDTFARTAVFRPDGEVNVEHVLPTLKPASFVAGVEELAAERGHAEPLVTLPVIDDLFMVLVLDTPHATRMLKQSDLAKLGTTREALAQRALVNLRGRSNGFKYSEVAPGLYALAANDAYDSASFLLHAEWAVLREPLGGAPVVAPIGRDLVLFTGESSRTGLETMRLILLAEAQEPKAPYPITTRPYRWTPEGWVYFPLSASTTK